MATRNSDHSGRTLAIFFAVLALCFGLVALAGQWKPNLGLDLQGGTRITLIAEGNPSASRLAEAQRIIDARVNGSGVAEADVKTQGNRFIVVEIPGQSRRDLVDTVKRQAQLRFRLVAKTGMGVTQPSPSASPSNGLPNGPVVTVSPPAQPSTAPGDTKKQTKKQQKDKKKSGNNRAGFLPKADKKDKKKSKKQDQTSGPTALPSASATVVPTDDPTVTTDQPGAAGADDPLAWMDNPPQSWVDKFDKFTCPAAGSNPDINDNPNQPLITCDPSGVKYLLSKAALEGGDLSKVSLLAPGQQNVQWGVSLQFDSAGTKQFAKISDSLYNTEKQFAIVLDGEVISAPTMDGIIHDGRAQITGNFKESTARSLTTSLKFGSLPIAFQNDPPVETVGPSLAGEQLSGGIAAGVAGLLLVMLYCLFYYRGLGLVVIASLIVAGAATYALVMLLSKTAGFTLTLPGIAGLIVAVGITADSFIVYFERIRDEMRDGKSMRLAVQAGWKRARNTCVAADMVTLLAAVVLYIFAAGVVKGFAFALGLTTLIDLGVFFWFTHPMMTLLGRYPFFNRGHKFSGLAAESLGVDEIVVGGRV